MTKRYVMEFLGTFFLAVAIVFTRDPLPIGLMLMALAYIGGHVSGANYNPAFSLASYLRGRLSQKDMFIYWGVQILGAFVAIWLYKMVTESMYIVDVPVELSGTTVSFLSEALLTLVFTLTFLTVTQASKFNNTTVYGVAVGLTLMAIAFLGGLFNPAVGFAAMACRMIAGGQMGTWQALVVLVGGPLAGGAAASYLYSYLND